MKLPRIKKHALTLSLLVAAVLVVAPTAFANQPGNCPPLGVVNVGPPPPYDFVANGSPSSDTCWAETNLTFVTNYDYCSYWRNYWDFSNGGVLSQTMTVPSTMHITGVKLLYILDFIDPHSDGNANAIRADIYDQTNGNTWIGGDYWSGYSGSLYCSQRTGYGVSYVDLAGHTLQLSFSVRKGYSDVHINAKMVSLLQN
jgi:hypothetical protein